MWSKQEEMFGLSMFTMELTEDEEREITKLELTSEWTREEVLELIFKRNFGSTECKSDKDSDVIRTPSGSIFHQHSSSSSSKSVQSPRPLGSSSLVKKLSRSFSSFLGRGSSSTHSSPTT